MKYIRTRNSIREIINDYGNCCSVKSNHRKTIDGFTIIYGLAFASRADTIEELCDEFVVVDKEKDKHIFDTIHNGFLVKGQYGIDARYYTDRKYKVYGAIWTDKGLIYVAKMNDKGELELL